MDSGRVTPETAHTSLQEGLRYFHFGVAPNGQPGKRTDLLLSDRSGEVYWKARNNSTVVETLPEIPQADRIVLLLDGGRVADPIMRNGAIHSTRQTLRVFLDNGALGLGSIVQVVVTKFDLIASSPDVEEIRDALAFFQERLSTDFANRVKSLSFHDIAARDPTTRFSAWPPKPTPRPSALLARPGRPQSRETVSVSSQGSSETGIPTHFCDTRNETISGETKLRGETAT